MRRLIKRFDSVDGARRVDIVQIGDGLYRYSNERWIDTSEETGETGDGFYSPFETSGIYPSAEAAESDAHAAVDWLRDKDHDG